MRADLALVASGHARSRTHARRIIEEGRARLGGVALTKPSAPVEDLTQLDVADVPDGVEYASRAAHKLDGALTLLDVDPRGLRCLDAGASTGGFTDVLLRRGAARVVAVDIGHDQLAAHLADDPRVRVRDGTSIRGLALADVDGAADLTVADLSFISLTTVIEDLARVTSGDGHLLLMVKPQFEVGRSRLGRGGIVRDPALQADAVKAVVSAADAAGLRLHGAGESSLPGEHGNREFFVLLGARDPHRGPASAAAGAGCGMIDRIVDGRTRGGRLPE